MPLNEEYLETHQVIHLTQHFLAKKTQEGHFASQEAYFQSPLEGKSFGGASPSSVIAVAKRPAGQPPVLFACDGEPDDKDRKEAKEPWKFSEIVLKAMSEWVSHRDSKEDHPQNLDFDLHLALRKGNHWTVYVFKFKGAQQSILAELAELKKQHSQAEIPRESKEAKGGGKRVDAPAYLRQQKNQKEEVHGLLGRLYQSVTVSYIDTKRWRVPQAIQTDLRAIFGHRLPITPLECTYQLDGYSCGDRTARNIVAAALEEPLNNAIDTYHLRLETMAILGMPLIENTDFFTGYILLRFITILIICFILNYFLSASMLAVIGGVGGLLGLCLITWLLFEVGKWLMQPETRAGEAAAYARFKAKAAAAVKAVSSSDKPVLAGSLLGPTAALSPISIPKPGTSPSHQPSPAPTTKHESKGC